MKTFVWLLFMAVIFTQVSLGSAQDDNKGEIGIIAWSGNGKYIALGYTSGRIEILDIETDQFLYSNDEFTGVIKDLDFSFDSHYLAMATGGRVQVIDIEQGERLRSFEGDIWVTAVSWHSDDEHLVAVSANGTGSFADYRIRIWNVATGKLENSFLSLEAVSVGWNFDGTLLAVSSASYPTRIVDRNGNLITKLSDTKALTVAWNPQNNLLATGGFDNIINIWDTTSGELLFSLDVEGRNIQELDWSPNGQFLVAPRGQSIKAWDISTGNLVLNIPSSGDNRFNSVAWNPDGTQLAYADTEGNLEITIFPLGITPDSLRTKVAECVTDKGFLNSLNTKINVEQWQAFINEVEAQRDKKITSECADSLVEMATFLLEQE